MNQVFLTIVILLFGSAVTAQNIELDSLLNELKTAKDDTNKTQLLRNIGVAFANQDPRKAIDYWQQAVTLSRKLNYVKGLARNFINIGTGYSYLGKFDSTIIYADSGLHYSKIIGDPDRLALVYLNKGDAYRNLGDYRSSLLYCDTASIYAAKTNNSDRLARIYDITSEIYLMQKQFANAIAIEQKALALYRKDNNEMMEGSIYDDLGLVYQKMEKKDSAIYFHQLAIEIGERVKDEKNLSTYYYGLADSYTDVGKLHEAEIIANKSLLYAKQQESNVQLATAYSLLCKIYTRQERFALAVEAGNKAYNYAVAEVQIGWQQETADLLANAYAGMGDYKNAHHFLDISSSLKDSISLMVLDQQVTGLQASFELREKDKAILLLAKDKELQKQILFRQRLLFAGVGILLLTALFGIALLINRNKLRQRMKELELRNRIAADLHDEVGSSLSSIHMLSQMATTQSNEATHKDILSRMSSNAKETMEKMGDIVWMIKPGETEAGGLKERIERFAYEVCNAKNIEASLQVDELEKLKLSMEQRKNIYLIFKEAVNNAAKYSGTEKINITAALKNKTLELQVIDFGKGFDASIVKKGNGLDNMQKRAKDLEGLLHIDSDAARGTILTLTIPV